MHVRKLALVAWAAATRAVTTHPNLTAQPKSIAIIGAGSAGTSTAYYISRYAADAGLPAPQIDIFERSSYIGGRSTTVNAWDDAAVPLELGASIFVEVNYNLVHAVHALNLSVGSDSSRRQQSLAESSNRMDDDDAPMTLGIWNGVSFVLTTPYGATGRWSRWWSIGKLFWRYGFAPLRVQRLMRRTVDAFLKMYEAPQFPFISLGQAALQAGLLTATAATGRQLLTNEWAAGLFADEVVQASTRVNYAQSLDQIHGLEAMVCMAAEGAMSVDGSNWRIFDGMARLAGATVHLNSSVQVLRREEKGWTLGGAGGVGAVGREFDEVVLAAPFQFANLSITPAPKHTPDTIPYVELHVTLFASPLRLSPLAFGLPLDHKVPEVVLTTLPPEKKAATNATNLLGPKDFFSISQLRVALNKQHTPPRQEYLYKIFSPAEVSDEFLGRLLGVNDIGSEQVSWVYRKIWHSYPYLYPRVTFEEIQLDDHLWYTSGIESFISTMETSSLMGKNVARLVLHGWLNGSEGEYEQEEESKPSQQEL